MVVINVQRRKEIVIAAYAHEGTDSGIEACALGGHQGSDKTGYSLSSKYWWPNLWSNVEHFVKTCERCQKNSSKMDKSLKKTTHYIAF